MRISLVIVAFAVTAGCGSKDKESTEVEPTRAKALDCIGYQSDYWREAATADEPKSPDRERYRCAGVYGEASCPAAWTDDAADPVAALAAACAKAYCGQLAEPKPALCKRSIDAFKERDRVPALVELDRAILTRELGDPGLAQQLSARLRLFEARRKTGVEIELPRAASGEEEWTYLVVSITKTGELFVAGEAVDRDRLAGRLTKARAGDPELRLVIDADRDAAYDLVVEVMDTARQAGFERISLSSGKPEPPQKEKR